MIFVGFPHDVLIGASVFISVLAFRMVRLSLLLFRGNAANVLAVLQGVS